MQLTTAARYGKEITSTEPKRGVCGRITEEPIRPDVIHPNHLGDRRQVLRHRRLHARANPQVAGASLSEGWRCQPGHEYSIVIEHDRRIRIEGALPVICRQDDEDVPATR